MHISDPAGRRPRADTFSVDDKPADPSFLDRGMSLDEAVSWMIADEAGLDGRAVAASGQPGQTSLKLLRAAAKTKNPGRRAELIERTVRSLAALRGTQHAPLIDAVLTRIGQLTPQPNQEAHSGPSINPHTGLQEFFSDGLSHYARAYFDQEARKKDADPGSKRPPAAQHPNAAPARPDPVRLPIDPSPPVQANTGLLAPTPNPATGGLLAIDPIPVSAQRRQEHLPSDIEYGQGAAMGLLSRASGSSYLSGRERLRYLAEVDALKNQHLGELETSAARNQIRFDSRNRTPVEMREYLNHAHPLD